MTPHHGGQPYVTPTDTIGYQAAKAYEAVFGQRPVPLRDGGIPIVPMFEEVWVAKPF